LVASGWPVPSNSSDQLSVQPAPDELEDDDEELLVDPEPDEDELDDEVEDELDELLELDELPPLPFEWPGILQAASAQNTNASMAARVTREAFIGNVWITGVYSFELSISC
jgi:hypothetical protein